MSEKPKLSVYWASSCGGCEIAVVNLHEKLLDVDRNFDFVFCPCLLDTKVADVEAMADRSIAVTFFNGAVRTAENEEMAHLLRRKSRLLVAFGACSVSGSIPALSNLHSRESHLRTNFLDSPALDNPGGVVPQTRTVVAEGVLELPAFFDTVKTLAQVVDVDYFVPGCPPEPHQIWNIVEAVIEGKPLPPQGGTLGAGPSSVCAECSRKKEDKTVGRFYRTWEMIPDASRCLLEQGLLCMGIATSQGCGALCPAVNMPCTGCYGPPEGVRDQGAKMISALGSVIDIGPYKGMTEAEVIAKADAVLDSLPDLAGGFYRYSMAGSLVRRSR